MLTEHASTFHKIVCPKTRHYFYDFEVIRMNKPQTCLQPVVKANSLVVLEGMWLAYIAHTCDRLAKELTSGKTISSSP